MSVADGQSNAETASSLSSTEKELAELRDASSKADGSLKALRASHDTLKGEHDKLTGTHTSLSTKHEDLASSHDKIKAEYETASKSLKAAEESLKKVSSDLDRAKESLSQTTKRAEAAEKKRDGLHKDNADLVTQLDELRGKVAKTMEEKAEQAATIDSWVATKQAWDKERAELEAKLAAATVSLWRR